MEKTEWEQKVMELRLEQFAELWARNEAEGMRYAQAAMAAYKTVYTQEGK